MKKESEWQQFMHVACNNNNKHNDAMFLLKLKNGGKY